MNPYFKYGVPAAAGIGTAGLAINEREDLGSVGLAGIGGTLGAAAGLKAARAIQPQLAGKYGDSLRNLVGFEAPRQLLNVAGRVIPEERYGGKRAELAQDAATLLRKAAAKGEEKLTPMAQKKALAAGIVPATSLAAGLGGVAAASIPGAFGMPGFVDPESYGSSNSPGARYKQTTVNYV